MQNKAIFLGVDVSKSWLDFYINRRSLHFKVSNNSQGFKLLKSWLRSEKIALGDLWVALEYTGGYEYRLVQFLQSKKIRFTRIPGLEIKKSLGMQRGKNDKIDAKRICDYACEKQLKLRPETSCNAAIVRLKQLLTQRKAFVNDRKAYEHRMKELQVMIDFRKDDLLIKNYEATIAHLIKSTKKTEAAIEKLIAGDAAISKNIELIRSIPGIGPVNAWMTIAFTDNFENFASGRKYGAYSGVVPYEHSSGKSIRRKSRVSHMANKAVKGELAMAAKSAVTHDPELKQYYERRAALGKHHRSIMNEIKFKLILRMFAVVIKGSFM